MGLLLAIHVPPSEERTFPSGGCDQELQRGESSLCVNWLQLTEEASAIACYLNGCPYDANVLLVCWVLFIYKKYLLMVQKYKDFYKAY